MSLYLFEEVCKGCIHASWHSCDQCYRKEAHFCNCELKAEPKVNHYTGACKYKCTSLNERSFNASK